MQNFKTSCLNKYINFLLKIKTFFKILKQKLALYKQNAYFCLRFKQINTLKY